MKVIVANKSKSSKSNKKLPLTLRLKAWWEGYDSEEVEKRYVAKLPDEPVEEVAKEEETAEPEVPLDPWSKDLININQYVWGAGFCGPGGPDYIIGISKLLALNPEMSMVQIGAAIGGPARVLNDKFGVWMSGYEESPAMVEKGNEMSKRMGVDKKVTLEQYDPDEFEGFDRKFDRAFAKEALFTIKDKAGMIAHIESKLKPGGLMLTTDYVLNSDAVIGKDNFKAWKVGERRTPYPVLAQDYADMFKKVNMQVRVSEDITENYIEMINEAWAGADSVAAELAKQDDGPRLIQILMQEAEFWTRRKQILESGDIRLWRFVANKKSSGPSMMSDW